MPRAYRPDPRFSELGDGFFDEVTPARFPRHVLRFRNQRWAERVGLGSLDRLAWEKHFARFEPLPRNLERPLAMRYHGHQFDSYNPDLGDGRGFLFAQLRDDTGRLLDLGTKGSGRTPWSRSGDGRLTLKGGFREVLATELLEALGVETSKSFSLFETGEALERHDEPSPTRASVLVRLSHGHVRVGTFQRHAHHRDTTRITALLEHCVTHYAPSLASARDLPDAFLRHVRARTARLAGQWMAAGFVHGVLNSDNQNITGESFDYGPWRFLPVLDPRFTAAYFDQTGLYAFARQPGAVLRNVQRLGHALQVATPSLDVDAALRPFEPEFERGFRDHMLWRLGVRDDGSDHGQVLVDTALALLGERSVGYAQFFHDWFGGVGAKPRAMIGPARQAYRGPRFDAFLAALEHVEPRLDVDPAHFAWDWPDACDLLIDEVEALWTPIANEDDWRPFEAKIARIRELGDALAGRPSGA